MVLIDLQFFRREVSWGLGWLSASYTWVGSIHYSGIPVMGITAAKKKPKGCHPFTASCTIPCLGSGAPDGSLLIMLRKYPSERHLLLSDCSCGSKEQATCCQTGIVHMQSPASTAEEKQQTLCAWMQSTNFSKSITEKGASCLPFSGFVYQPAVSPNWFCIPGWNLCPQPQSRETFWKCHRICTLGHEFGVHIPVLSILIAAQHPLAGPGDLLVEGWCSGFVFFHSFSRSSCLFSLVLVTGTIRKAQNLLKQYSQHGLDGKKGASNLIPMEGNHSSSYFTLNFLCLSALLSQVGLPLVQCLVDSIGLGNQGDAGGPNYFLFYLFYLFRIYCLNFSVRKHK